MQARKLLKHFKPFYYMSDYKMFCSSSVVYAIPKQIYTAKLIPEIENMLEKNEIKHRKHPGIRKFPVMALPDWLLEAIPNVINEQEEPFIIKTAEELVKTFYHQRLPMEKFELEQRTVDKLEKFSVNMEQLSENKIYTEKIMKKVRKELNCEIYRWKPTEYTSHTALAYLVARLAPNYACVSKVFQEISIMLPSFKPVNFFDFGCGVGSATWAAHNQWKNYIKEYYCVDSSSDMIKLCEQLAGGDEESEKSILKEVYFRQFLPMSNKHKFDLVVSAFSLMELPSLSERIRVIDTLWQKTRDMLVIVENGGSAGFSCILEARDYISKIETEGEASRSTGAHIVAPCPHEQLCPLFTHPESTRACHLKVNYYSPYPRKDALVVKQDPFSYVVIRRGTKTNDANFWPRVIHPVLKSSRKAHCRLCHEDGKLYELILTKKRNGRHTYRCAKISSQGDLLPVTISLRNDPWESDGISDGESTDDEKS